MDGNTPNAEENKCKYLVVSNQDELYGIYVNTVGYQSVLPGMKYPIHEHPKEYLFNVKAGRILHEYQLIYITKGKGVYIDSMKKNHEIQKGCLMLVFPEVWHSYYPLKQYGWDEYYIGFNGNIIKNIEKCEFISPQNSVIEIGMNEDIATLYANALEIAKKNKAGTQQQLGGIVMHILGKALAISKNRYFNSDDSGEKIEQAKIIMHECIYKDCNPQEIAEELNIGYSWFRKTFKDYTGCAPAKYLQELRINTAKQMLMDTSLPIKEIAYKLKYSSAEHFNIMFKKRTRMTPCEYRNSKHL